MPDDVGAGNWLSELRRGNAWAAEQLWGSYFEKLVRLARSRLPTRFRRAADEEDVALSALRTFVRRTSEGQFASVGDGDDLWRLLVHITARKAWKLMEREGRQKRGGGLVVDEAALAGAEEEQRGIEQVVGHEPTPDLVVQATETCEHLLQSLPDETLRQVARLMLEGFTLEEIAGRVKISIAAAGRKSKRVREIWAREMQS